MSICSDQYDTIDSDDSEDSDDNYDDDSQSSNEGENEDPIERKMHSQIMMEDDFIPMKAPERTTYYSISELQL